MFAEAIYSIPCFDLQKQITTRLPTDQMENLPPIEPDDKPPPMLRIGELVWKNLDSLTEDLGCWCMTLKVDKDRVAKNASFD